MISMRNLQAPATTDEIKVLLSPLSDRALMDIRRIGPTLSELKEARTFLESQDYMGEVMERTMSPRPRRVYIILKKDRCAAKPCCS